MFPTAEPPLDGSEPTASHLSVKAVEWSYTLSRPEVTAGEVVVELNNQGEDSHNLKIQREGSGEPPLAVPEAAAAQRTDGPPQPAPRHLPPLLQPVPARRKRHARDPGGRRRLAERRIRGNLSVWRSSSAPTT